MLVIINLIIVLILIFILTWSESCSIDSSEEHYKDKTDCTRKCMSRNRNSRSKCTNECKTQSGVIKWT
jgi:hypothetical protein